MINKLANLTHKLFYDNKVLMAFSLILAVIIWLVVAISLSPIDTATIKDVPVTIDLTNSVPAQFDLEIFGQSEFTVDVEVSGKRYIVNSKSVNKDSVKVVAQTAYVDSAGKHALALKISKVNENDEFEIVSASEDYVEVYFDVYKELDFPIEPKIISDGDVVKSGYTAGEPVLSAETVTVSGPATEVDNVYKIYAELEVERALTETKTQAADINAYNSDGGIIHYLTFNYANSDITITLPVYYIVERPTAIDFTHAPIALVDRFNYTVSPSSIKAGVYGADADNVPELISVATIDFSLLKPGKNSFVFNADEIPSLILLDGTKEFNVDVYVTDCVQRTINVIDENISFINIPDGFEVNEIVKSVGAVTVSGPQSSVSNVIASDIYAVVDLADIDVTAAEQSVPVRLNIKNSNDCWVSGEYNITIR